MHFLDDGHGVRHMVAIFPGWLPLPANDIVNLLLNSPLNGIGLVSEIEHVPHDAATDGVSTTSKESQCVARDILL